jgi:hypothetical protein
MKFQHFRCSMCKGATVALGYVCLCGGPSIHESQRFKTEAVPICNLAQHPVHGSEFEVERESVMPPVPAAITGYVLHADPISYTLTGYPAEFPVRSA